MKEKKNNLFCCFSVPLKDFLTEKGIRYEMCALNEKSHKTMWVYMRTEELGKYLDEWRLRRPT